MATVGPITTTEILDEIIEPSDASFGTEFARLVLKLRFNDSAHERIREFLRRNNAGTLPVDEKAVLDNYLLVGQFLDLLQAKARVNLQGGTTRP